MEPPQHGFDLEDAHSAAAPVGEPGLPDPADSHSVHCLNCHTALQGTFCHHCGQENEPSLLSVGALLKDLWENFVDVDAKLLKTIWLLFTRPGFLTVEYLAGRRARYISPFKLYFWVTAFFVLFSFRAFYIEDEVFEGGEKNASVAAAAIDRARHGGDPNDVILAARKNRGVVPPMAPPLPGKTAKANPDPDPNLDLGNLNGVPFTTQLDTIPWELFGVHIDPKLLPESVGTYEDIQRHLLPAERDSIYVRFIKIKAIRFQKNRYDAVRNLIYSALPNVLLFAVPFWATMMMPFFRRPRRLYIEHLVFVLHGHTVLVLLALLRLGLGKLLIDPMPGLVASTRTTIGMVMTQVAVVYLLGYLLIASRRVYRQSVPVLLVKGGCLTMGYGCILVWAITLGIVVTLIATLVNL